MGFNAVLVVLNDRLYEIENDREFGKKVADAIRHYYDPPELQVAYITGQTQVISVHHANTMQVVAVGANTGRVIGHGHWRDTDEELVKAVQRQIRAKACKEDVP